MLRRCWLRIADDATSMLPAPGYVVRWFQRSRENQLQEENAMPLVQVRLIEGVFNGEQKNRMIEKLTDAMVSIEGENLRGVTWVTIEEVPSGDWGIGGKALTTDAVKALASGKPAA
jgi:4-oxalocrotonate tautomerase